jgi:hypothetical protein
LTDLVTYFNNFLRRRVIGGGTFSGKIVSFGALSTILHMVPRLGRKAGHSRPFNADIDEWSCTSSSPYAFNMRTGGGHYLLRDLTITSKQVAVKEPAKTMYFVRSVTVLF